MTVQLAIPVLRQLLQIAGGVLISRGYLDAESHEAVTGIVLNAVPLPGGCMTVARSTGH